MFAGATVVADVPEWHNNMNTGTDSADLVNPLLLSDSLDIGILDTQHLEVGLIVITYPYKSKWLY